MTLFSFNLTALENNLFTHAEIFQSEFNRLLIHNLSEQEIEIRVDDFEFFLLNKSSGRFIECEGKDLLILESKNNEQLEVPCKARVVLNGVAK